MFFFSSVIVFAGSNSDKMPVEKRDSIISEKKYSPSNGQGLYSFLSNNIRGVGRENKKNSPSQEFSFFYCPFFSYPNSFATLSSSLFVTKCFYFTIFLYCSSSSSSFMFHNLFLFFLFPANDRIEKFAELSMPTKSNLSLLIFFFRFAQWKNHLSCGLLVNCAVY